ncbi:dihydroneopterin aldolase [Aurantiacibacter sediminis]|uniref:Dihydroneopterin aldolase n=1 Tax=Aurantiacibacter sediminis TaxID=2793064 RepID=A0ABS0N2B4_9SPHN|nr:dihydroneopterin aldolase [Aurantiacibacter sediminis]MBH5322087.1 dihydroneopterin aldolase [Aurantiacibacter sediminis]
MADSLYLELTDFEHDVHTGIYSEETGKPQPLRFTVRAKLKEKRFYDPETPLEESKNYMDLKFACSEALGDRHYKLIEAVADHVCETLFLQDGRVEQVQVKIVKLALSERNEQIGITLTRDRP